tara:strand:- start:11008 stop:11565 length:558 start_codon:yes stop_codon:yes gene_type:complete
MQRDFRHALRDRSRKDHDLVDRMITTLDITRLDDFANFLQIHLSCFVLMQSRASEPCLSTATLSDMIAELAADLDILSAKPKTPPLPLPRKLDPLAIDYMVAGSRLGSKILCKRWGASTDPRVRRANNYFGQAGDPKLWPATCRALTAIPADGPRAADIVKDTKTQFQLFAAAYAKIATTETEHV